MYRKGSCIPFALQCIKKNCPQNLFKEKNGLKKIPVQNLPVNLSVISTVCGSLGFHCYVLHFQKIVWVIHMLSV